MSNSIVEEDTKLKEGVIESLATNGFLSEFKAKLSVEIIKALESDLEHNNYGNSTLGDQLPKTEIFQKLQQNLQTIEGSLALFLIEDTLRKLGLHYSHRIFLNEIGEEWTLYKDKSKKEAIENILNNFNLPMHSTNEKGSHNNNKNGNNDADNLTSNNKEQSIISRPLLIEILAKILRGEIGSESNSFSNETFTKSPSISEYQSSGGVNSKTKENTTH